MTDWGYKAQRVPRQSPCTAIRSFGEGTGAVRRPQQLLDPAQLVDILGVDLADVRTLVVKSRGHFDDTAHWSL
jgi:hypothetical protein